MKNTEHKETLAVRGINHEDIIYCGKGWKARFECPVCKRVRWQHLNYLGRRLVTCDGKKWGYKPIIGKPWQNPRGKITPRNAAREIEVFMRTGKSI